LEKILKKTKLGYEVFPLKLNGKEPAISGWKEAATTDEQTIRDWFNEYSGFNWGLHCKDMIVLDVDKIEQYGNPFVGREDFAGVPTQVTPGVGKLKDENDNSIGDLPGLHYFFKRPEGKDWGNSAGKFEQNVDIKTDRGYIVIAPSTIDGKPYEFLIDLPPIDELPDLPDDVVKRLDEINSSRPYASTPIPRDPVREGAGEQFVSGSTHVVQQDYWGDEDRWPHIAMEQRRKRAIAYLASIDPAVMGEHGSNPTFWAATALVCGYCLDDETAMDILWNEYNPRCQPEWSVDELKHKVEDARAKPIKRRGFLLDKETDEYEDTDRERFLLLCQEMEEGYDPFPIEVLPPVIQDFVGYTADRIGCDPVFVVSPLLPALAVAIGNTAAIQIDTMWKETPIIWTATIGDPGTGKSAPFAGITKLFHKTDTLKMDELDVARSNHEIHLREWEAQTKLFKKKKIAHPPKKPDKPSLKRTITADATVEAVVGILQDNPRGIGVMCDELSGFLKSFDQYKKGNSDPSFWEEAFEGGRYTVDRKGSGFTRIQSCSVCISGTIQPKVLADTVQKGNMADGGFLQRFLLTKPKSRFCTRKKRKDRQPDTQVHENYEKMQKLFDSLLRKQCEFWPDGNVKPHTYGLTEEADEFLVDEQNRNETEWNVARTTMRGFIAKCAKFTARISLILHVVNNHFKKEGGLPPSGKVEISTVKAAAKIVQWYTREHERIYGSLGLAGALNDTAEWILGLLKKNKEMTLSAISQSSRKFKSDRESLKPHLDSLIGQGRVEMITKETTVGVGGKPTISYRLKS
ncbi:MAG: DUF3987 domain-containing protein, partial [Thermoguttaceae bacterium]